MPKHPGAPTSRRPHRSPSRRSKASEVPLSGLGSPTQFHRLHTARSDDTEMPTFHAPSEVPSPSASCRSRGATLLRRDPSPPVTLRPQGFAPSRRFAPPTTCRAYFIPVPLLGFPFEACPHTVPYALSSAGPLRFLTTSSRMPPPPQGSSTPCRSCPRAWGLARLPRRCLLGIGHFEASCDDQP
jgi:hypothetical protein